MNDPVASFLLEQFQVRCAYQHRNNLTNRKVAVIVDTRQAFFLPYVIKNVASTLGAEWNVHVFHGLSNEAWLKAALSGWQIRWSSLGLDHLSKKTYNALFKSVEFWQLFPEDHILVFQLDSILFHRPLDSLLRFSMIGAPCGVNSETWNGGLSLRTKAAMVRVLQENPEEVREHPYEAEDVFFSRLLRKSIWSITPPLGVAVKFSAESLAPKDRICVGAHGTDKPYMPSSVWKELILHAK